MRVSTSTLFESTASELHTLGVSRFRVGIGLVSATGLRVLVIGRTTMVSPFPRSSTPHTLLESAAIEGVSGGIWLASIRLTGTTGYTVLVGRFRKDIGLASTTGLRVLVGERTTRVSPSPRSSSQPPQNSMLFESAALERNQKSR